MINIYDSVMGFTNTFEENTDFYSKQAEICKRMDLLDVGIDSMKKFTNIAIHAREHFDAMSGVDRKYSDTHTRMGIAEDDLTLREQYVGTQMIFELWLAAQARLGKLDKAMAAIHTPSPSSPTRLSADCGNIKMIAKPESLKSSSILTLTGRRTSMGELLESGVNVVSVYSIENKDLVNNECKALQKEYANFHDMPLGFEPKEISESGAFGATYYIMFKEEIATRNKRDARCEDQSTLTDDEHCEHCLEDTKPLNQRCGVYSIRFCQIAKDKTAEEHNNCSMWFGSKNDKKIRVRVNAVEEFCASKGFSLDDFFDSKIKTIDENVSAINEDRLSTTLKSTILEEARSTAEELETKDLERIC